MIFLKSFRIPTDDEEEFFFIPPPVNPDYKTKNFRTVYQTNIRSCFSPEEASRSLNFPISRYSAATTAAGKARFST